MRIFWILIVRIIVLAAVVVGYSLSMPWRIIVPLTIGTVTIVIETLACLKRPSERKERKSNAKQKARAKDNKKTA